MNITVITGSPHRRGTSALLADEFIRGAKEVGHMVYRFDAAFEEVHPCQGCDHCGMGSRPCVWKDSMTKLNPELLGADGVVQVTPLYYFGFPLRSRPSLTGSTPPAIPSPEEKRRRFWQRPGTPTTGPWRR